MKCLKCGKEIANDSKFCEFCGAKIEQKIKAFSLKKLIIICLSLVIIILAVLLLVFRGAHNPATDRNLMNLKGNVVRIIEKSIYITSDKHTNDYLKDHGNDVFDSEFLMLVYGNNNMTGRVLYKKWFTSQVSNCEIQFNEYGNIKMLQSIDERGCTINYIYDNSNRLIEMSVPEKDITIKYSHKTGRKESALGEDFHYIYKDYLWENDVRKDTTIDIPSSITYLYKGKKIKQATLYMLGYDSGEGQCVFDYVDNRVVAIRLNDLWEPWGYDGDHFIKIEYNSRGDISSVTSSAYKGRGTNVTTFGYQYDSNGNWISRTGKTKNSEGWEFTIESTRDYIYQ